MYGVRDQDRRASFVPPERTLMGPGPSDVHPRVLKAMARPTVGHLDPAFLGMMDEVKELLRYAFQTDNEVTFPISGPASLGMETCIVNLLEKGDAAVVCRNGVFGGRMAQNVERCGGRAIVVDDDWGAPVSPDKLAATLTTHPEAGVVAFVAAETSTGALSDVKTLVAVAHEHDRIVIVDAVTALAGCPVNVDEWDIDVVYAGSQKCLSCPPGLAPISLNDRALHAVKSRRSPCQSWFMDIGLQLEYWRSGKRAYHHTAPVNALYGLHEALLMLEEEGLESAWRRHRRNHLALKDGLEAVGLELFVDEPARLPQLNVVRIPREIDDGAVRGSLLEMHGLEIGAGLGELAGKVWRIGLMGYSSRPENVSKCVGALEDVLLDHGLLATAGAGETAVQKAYASV